MLVLWIDWVMVTEPGPAPWMVVCDDDRAATRTGRASPSPPNTKAVPRAAARATT